jgi:5'-methylthioadenosine phosphorylase|tara:strand:+ start:199 stop:1071 length:873 start_codon:yes stop_codon:yes gene_type:complete
MKTCVGIIGGSGLYDLKSLQNTKWIDVSTPWGDPSDQILSGEINNLQIYFLPRHGRGHYHSPSTVPYKQNIYALKKLGVTNILSVSACGSLKEDLAPGDFVLVDQFIDRTYLREKSFFGKGCVAHVSLAHPTCNNFSKIIFEIGKKLEIKIQLGGTYMTMEGPQFSTLAESKLYKDNWKCDVIGMTNMPEAKLAKEAEICYTSLSMVTDFDCWHPDHDSVEVSDIIETLTNNSSKAQRIIETLPEFLKSNKDLCSLGCNNALDNAIITAPEKRDPKVLKTLDVLLQRLNK